MSFAGAEAVSETRAAASRTVAEYRSPDCLWCPAGQGWTALPRGCLVARRFASVVMRTDTALALPLGFAIRAACGGTNIISVC